MDARVFFLAALVAMALPAAAAPSENKIPIVDEGKLPAQWSVVPGSQLMPPYPEAYAKDPEEVCMVVGYLVNADGHTSDFSLLKSWTSGSNSRSRNKFWAEFADLASRALAQWRYVPRDSASAQPVYTASTFVFGSRESALATQAHCAIADLPTRLVELRYDGRAGRMMSRGIFSRLEIDPKLEERVRQEVIATREFTNQERMGKAELERLQQKQSPPPSSGTK